VISRVFTEATTALASIRWRTWNYEAITFYLDDISLLRTDLTDAKGTISGALWRQGPTGSVLRFDSVGDDSVKVTGDMIGTGAVSIEALVYLNGWGPAGFGRILCNGPCDLDVQQTNARLALARSEGSAAQSAINSLALGNWYHIVATSTSTAVINMYINGVLSGTANQDKTDPTAGTDTYIGNKAALDRGFDGDIALLRLYDKALTAGEVYEAYRAVGPMVGLG